ncbi:MAG: hypothetical protein NZM07_10190, partial [Elioraea sp.]|nr:hypothetical protein [Elioraea sp.]
LRQGGELKAPVTFLHDRPLGPVVGRVTPDLALLLLEVHEVNQDLRRLSEESKRRLAAQAAELFADIARRKELPQADIDALLARIELDRETRNELARLRERAALLAQWALYRIREQVGDWLHRYDVTRDGAIFVLDSDEA